MSDEANQFVSTSTPASPDRNGLSFSGAPDGQQLGFEAKAQFRPVKVNERLLAIDFVRGMALLGILVVNTASFFSPFLNGMDYRSGAEQPWWDQIAIILVAGLFAGKFISTFSMLFGYGLLGQIERAHAAGRSPLGFAARRLGALALFGLIHALGLWYGDILFVYAGLGGFLLFFRGVSARTLFTVAVIFLSINIVLSGGFQSLSYLAGDAPPERPVVDKSGPRGFQAMRKGPMSAEWYNGEVLAFREGPLSDAFAFRLVNWIIILVVTPLFVCWQILGMFLLGCWMWRVRFFDPEQTPLRQKVLGFALPLGLLLSGLGMVLLAVGLQGSKEALIAATFAFVLGITFLPAGYVALFATLSERLPGWLTGAIASAGRMALTVYLLETVIATWLSYWWGWQLFGRVGPAWQLLIALSIWTFLVLFAILWLRVFQRGPMEYLWRWLEYGRLKTAG